MAGFPFNLDPIALPRFLAPVPTQIRAGDTVTWEQQYDLYPPAGGYMLSYVLVSQSALITVQSASGPETYRVTVPSATTAAWAPGLYRWQAYIRDTMGNRTTVGEGVVEVLPNLEAAAAGLDDREPDEIILANLVSMLSGKSTKDAQEYEINGRRLRYYTWKELVDMRSIFEARVRKIRLKRGEILPGRAIGVVFRNGF